MQRVATSLARLHPVKSGLSLKEKGKIQRQEGSRTGLAHTRKGHLRPFYRDGGKRVPWTGAQKREGQHPRHTIGTDSYSAPNWNLNLPENKVSTEQGTGENGKK